MNFGRTFESWRLVFNLAGVCSVFTHYEREFDFNQTQKSQSLNPELFKTFQRMPPWILARAC